jgi:Periplasmic binding protein
VSRALRRSVAAVTILVLVATACGNSDGESSPTTTGGSDGQAATGGEGDRDTFVSISGVPGVSDDEIAFAAIGTRTNNPLGTCILDCYLQGIEAYFAFRNSEGGIYGRDLVIGQELDDALGNNQAKSLEVTSGDDVFGAFQATLLASGWGDLDAAGVPTYTWGIHATEAADRANIFPSTAIRCADCLGRAVPYAVQQAGATKVAALGYGVSENSKVCTNTVADSIELYSDDIGAEAAYVNDELAYGLGGGVGPQVTEMKSLGVDFIATCIDLNGMKTLAQELARQGMEDVVLYHPNTYNQSFVAEAGDLFEGDYVSVQFLPFEADTSGTALQDFLEWMDELGSEPSELAMVGWINATLAFDGLLAAGPEFDRAKVTAATNAMTAFDAGGLIEPIDWTAAHGPYTQATRDVDPSDECTSLVQVEGGEFVTVAAPETPWLCWPGDDIAWSEPEQVSFG